MDPLTILAMAVLMAIGAALYTAVGHAGASAYLAIMALFAVAPDVMRPTALTLNILVASLATWRYVRAGQFDAGLLAPFVIAAIPAAFIAGTIQLSPALYRPVVAIVLFLAAIRLLWPDARPAADPCRPAKPVALVAGAGIGTLSGLTGTGGGIFLSPLILLMGWATPRVTSGVASAFILCVSIAGLAGNLSSVGRLPAELPWLVAAVVVGAFCGTWLGTARLRSSGLMRVLGLVLLVAAAKLGLT